MKEYVVGVVKNDVGASLPTEIRERIVRCRDCAYASPCPLADNERLICAFHDEMLVSPDDFCSWGEPREVDA